MLKTARILAYFNGWREFRLSATAHYDDYDLLSAYDRGREHAHIATFRHFDDTH